MQTTDYGKTIQHRLIDMDKPKRWLIDEVRAKTGLYFDTSYFGKIVTGRKSTPKIVNAINEILGITNDTQ